MIPSNLSVLEIAKFAEQMSIEDLAKAYNDLVDKVLELEDANEKQDKYYESAMEQSSFRANVIEDILITCRNKMPRFTETKELIKEIEKIVDESYVEL